MMMKKTDRVRKTKSHELLESTLARLNAILAERGGNPITMTRNSTSTRYMRALFDVHLNDQTIYAVTGEEIHKVFAGVELVLGIAQNSAPTIPETQQEITEEPSSEAPAESSEDLTDTQMITVTPRKTAIKRSKNKEPVDQAA